MGVPHRIGARRQGVDQFGVAGQRYLEQGRVELACRRLFGQPTVDAPQGQKHLGPRGCQFAVTQHRELGSVDAPQIEVFG